MESAVVLPLALTAVYGIAWSVQYAALDERVQTAVRYSGVLGSTSQPYSDYSLYSLYNGVGPDPHISTYQCPAPPPDFTSGGTDVSSANPINIAPFFQNNANPSPPNSAGCVTTRTVVSGGSLSRSYMLLESQPSISVGMPQFGNTYGGTLPRRIVRRRASAGTHPWRRHERSVDRRHADRHAPVFGVEFLFV